MVVLLPYPDNDKLFNDLSTTKNDKVVKHRENILKYVSNVCTGPWSSDEQDMLYAGIRVRIGNERDLFLLHLKYGLGITHK